MLDKSRYIEGIRAELLNIEDNAKQIECLTESQWVAIRASHRLLGEYLDILSQLPLPSNLDEAAEEFAYTNWESEDYHEGASEGLPFDPIGHTAKCFKAGAEWMAKQGYAVEETVYFERFCDENRIMVNLGWGEPERGGFNPGDKVIVQIRKK